MALRFPPDDFDPEAVRAEFDAIEAAEADYYAQLAAAAGTERERAYAFAPTLRAIRALPEPWAKRYPRAEWCLPLIEEV